jgi:hypothetical protein
MGKLKYVYDGVEGIEAIGNHVGVSGFTLWRRMRRENISLEKAIAYGARKPQAPSTRKAAKKKEKKQVELVGIRYPDQLSRLWKIALAMETAQ